MYVFLNLHDEYQIIFFNYLTIVVSKQEDISLNLRSAGLCDNVDDIWQLCVPYAL